MEIGPENMQHIARGAAFLGAGGGGDPYIGRLFCEQMIREYGPPRVIALDELDDDNQVYPIALMGAPTAIVEKLVGGAEAELCISKLEAHTGKPATAILPCEMGGFNSMIPIALAALRGLPVVDADGMGRAFPEIQMTTFNVYGVPLTPLSITNEHQECVLMEARSAKSAEDIARVVAMRMGLSVMLSCYSMNGKDAKRTAVGGTLTLALEIGRAIDRGRKEGEPVEALLSCLRNTSYYKHCAVLFDGKIVDLLRETTRGFSIGHCHLAAADGSGAKMEIMFQNENLIARQDGKVRAIVPDLICIVDRETAEPITTDALRYGQRVKVIGASVAPSLRTPEALDVFGPSAFGIDEPFQPIESLLQDG